MLQFFYTSWLNGYKKMFCYAGRERRSAFISFIIGQLILFALIITIFSVLGFANILIPEKLFFTVLTIYFITNFLAILSYNVRRLHDANLSGLFCLFYILFMGLVVIVSMFIPPVLGDNRYGNDPR